MNLAPICELHGKNIMTRTSLTTEYFFSVVGRALDPEETRDAEVTDYIKRSEAIILSYTSATGDPEHGIWVDALCSAIQFDMVNRVYNNPAGKASEAMGPQNNSFVAPGGIYLLPAEREQLDKLKQGSRLGGLGTIYTYRDDFRAYGDSYMW